MKSKKTLCAVLALVLGFTLAGCSKPSSVTTANAQSNTQGSSSVKPGGGTTTNAQNKTQKDSSDAMVAEADDGYAKKIIWRSRHFNARPR